MQISLSFSTLCAAAALSLMCAVALSADAGTITYAGSLTDLGSAWRTASVSKGIFSSSGVLGTNGYYVVGDQLKVQQPSYVSSFTPSAATYGGNGSYAAIDNPLTTPGASPTLLQTGTFNQTVGASNTGTAFSFTVSAATPSILQIGLMVDNTDAAGWNDYAIALSSSISGLGPTQPLVSATYNDRNPDWVFFDITGATAGETFSVVPTAGANGHIQLGAVAFDTVVPEPASLTLVGPGLVGLAALRRRRASR